VLLPFQRAWVEDGAAVKVCEKSRRVGLSWCEAADDTLHAASERGGDVWYVGYNREMAEEFIRDCAFWARHFGLAATCMEQVMIQDENRDIRGRRIRFASGRRITALSSRPSNLRGKQGRVVIDEAAFHDDLAGLLKAAMALLMWGGSVRILSTHNGEDNPFNQLVQEIRAGKKPHSLHRVTLDEALDQGLFRRICLARGRTWSPEAEAQWRGELYANYGDAANEELDCVPRSGGASWLPPALVRLCMEPGVPVLRWACADGFSQLPEEARQAEAEGFCRQHLAPVLAALPLHAPCHLGEDFGRSGDLTVLAALTETGAGTHRAACQVEMRNVPFRQQEQVLFFLCDRLPRFSGAAFDARGNGQYLAEVAAQRYGAWRVQQVMLSVAWYLANMPPYKAALEDRRIILPLDPDVLDDHRAVRMDRGVAKVPDGYSGRGRDGGQRHGDSAVAWALAWHAASTATDSPMDWESTGNRRAFSPGDPY